MESSPDVVTKEEKLPGDDGRTADRLLQIAARLFRERGYGASTTRELSSQLGIQKASLYHHIRSKEDLLLAISLESVKRIIAAVAPTASLEDPGRRMEAVVAAHMKTALHDQDMHLTMLIELRSLSPEPRAEVLRLRDRYEKLLQRVIEDEQREGFLRSDIDAKYLTLALLNLLNWTIFWYDPEGDRSPAELASTLSTIFLEGSRPRSDNSRGASG